MSFRKDPNRPKRLLSIDGGGIRGIIATKILERMEQILHEKNPQWQCLADYFDFIGGTSTGAIIAASLAKGMRVKEILDIYTKFGQEMFTKTWCYSILGKKCMREKYQAEPLERKLREIFGEMTLGSPELKTRLFMVTKNVTEGTPWFFANDERHRFYEADKDILLWNIIRASSAAPTYFRPHSFEVNVEGKERKEEEFVDGGMSMFNNPAFQLFLETTYKGYGIGWERGMDNLLLVSVGTGFRSRRVEPGQAAKFWLWDWAEYSVNSLMNDAKVQQHILLELISGRASDYINYKPSSLISALFGMFDNQEEEPDKDTLYGIFNSQDEEPNPSQETLVQESLSKLLTYYRYSTSLTQPFFEKLGLSDIDPESVARLDCVDRIPELLRIGEAVAQKVSPHDFDRFLHTDD